MSPRSGSSSSGTSTSYTEPSRRTDRNEVAGAVVLGEPKSETRRRTIAVPRFVCERVCDIPNRPTDPDALLFADVEGEPIRHTGFYGRYWSPTVARLAAKDPAFPSRLRFPIFAIPRRAC